jgi:hypothetical protein
MTRKQLENNGTTQVEGIEIMADGMTLTIKIAIGPHQSVTTSSKCSLPQSMRAVMAGISERPVSVREYSTRGGTSG